VLSTLITSKTRIKLLLKFFLNPKNKGYLKNLETEFADSSNGIRIELNKFEEAGLLTAEHIGNKKVFKANQTHPLFKDIHSIVLKYTGIDQVIEKVILGLGNVYRAYLVGSFANGLESDVLDILIIGNVDRDYLITLIDKAEKLIGKKIRYLIYSKEEFLASQISILEKEHLLIWNSND
jgi:predicted nucleotidyltransferase